MASLLADLAERACDELPSLHRCATDDEAQLLSRLKALGITKLGERLRLKEALLAATEEDIDAAQAAQRKNAEPLIKSGFLNRPVEPPSEEIRAAEPVDDGPYAKGALVTITGLAKKPELNGQLAEVLGAADDGRHPVRVLYKGTNIRVKTDNLLTITPFDGGDDDVSGGGSQELATSSADITDLTDATEAATDSTAAPAASAASANPHHFSAAVASACDPSGCTAARMAALQTLTGCCLSPRPAHHEKLRRAELPRALVALIDAPCATADGAPAAAGAADAADAAADAAADDAARALRLEAYGCLRALCKHVENVRALVDAGVVDVLTRQVSAAPPLAASDLAARRGAFDALGAVASGAPEGKAAIGLSPTCVALPSIQTRHCSRPALTTRRCACGTSRPPRRYVCFVSTATPAASRVSPSRPTL